MANSLITYSLSRPFYGLNIPIQIQSTFMRDYAQKNNLIFQLPSVEICFINSYYVLLKLLTKTNGQPSDICMCSILMMPIEELSLLHHLLLINKNITWHFPMEGFIFDGSEILQWVNDYSLIKKWK